jgi:subtilisin family serine protease
MTATPQKEIPSSRLSNLQVISLLLGFCLPGWLAAAPVIGTLAGMRLMHYTPESLTFLLGAIPAGGLASEAVTGIVLTAITFLLETVVFAPLWLLTRRRRDWVPFHAIAGGMLIVAAFTAIWALAGLPFPRDAVSAAIVRLFTAVPFLILMYLPLRRDAPAFVGRPRFSTLLLAIGVCALILLPWLALGALGTLRQVLESAAQALSYGAGEELLLRGIVAALVARATGRPWIGLLAAYLAGFALQSGYLLPLGDWLTLVRIFNTLAIGLLATELAARGSLWPALLAHTAFEFGYPGFVDPRMQFALPHPAALESLAIAFFLGVTLWLGRKLVNYLLRHPSRALRLSVSSAFALAALAGSTAAYIAWGHPGLVQDGFLIVFREQADVSAANNISDPTERSTYVYRTLTETADRVQAPARGELERFGAVFHPHYLMNLIEVKGRADLMPLFAARPEVERVVPNPDVRIVRYIEDMGILVDPLPGSGAEWNISATGATRVWDAGITGKGVVVAGADTGVDWSHPALRSQYRGWDGIAAKHDYNWYDPWDGTTAPWDDYGHGTHTLGTILGSDGADNRIGMAPGAQWIACRNMRYGIGNPGAYLSCLEFFLAPFPVGGDPFRDGRPEFAAQVVNNSWGCPEQEGCSPDLLRTAADNLHAAGILMVAAAGNDGPACATAGIPPANYASVLTVGAVDSQGNLLFFSSRGPSDGAVKPDLTAPGAGIRSAIPGGRYALSAGTSMAAPHVAGAVALLWSADPSLQGDLNRTMDLLRRTARPEEIGATCYGTESADIPCLCGTDSPSAIPNNSYGYGVLDVFAAFQALTAR